MKKRLLKFCLLVCLFVSGYVKAQDAYLGEIKMFAGTFAPQGYAFCNGQLLPIAQNTALFSLLGTTYGGDGVTTFGLPDLRGRAPIHNGNSQGPGLSPRPLGQKGGAESNTLSVAQMPAHNHTLNAVSSVGNQTTPTNNTMADSGLFDKEYSDTNADTTMNANTVGNTGGNQPVNNMQPYTVINYIICLSGIYPSQS